MTDRADIVDDDDDTDLDPVPLPARRLRDPGVPMTIEDLAALRGGAIEVLEARVTVLEVARKRAIRLTSPSDWNLYKTPDGSITGFLHDAGCHRNRDVLSVSIFNPSEPRKVMAADGQSFMYVQTASGRSTVTGQVVEHVEGGRHSLEDFCKKEREGPDANPLALDLKVKKACRANVNGNVARELLGLKNVPLAALIDAWEGTTKDWNQCHKAQGFGTTEERLGGTREGMPDVPPPTCPHCKIPGELRVKNGKPQFYGCRNWSQKGHPKWTVAIDDWVKQAPKATPADDAAENARLDAEIAAKDAHAK